MIIERKKSLKNHRLFRGFSSPDTATLNSSNSSSSSSIGTGSFGRFRKRSSRSHNIFTANGNDGDYEEEHHQQQQPQHVPVLHPPLKKNQAAILQPTTVKAVHADPCVSLTIKEDMLITTDRRGRIRTWGRP